jgi:hypothetical protein
MLLILIMLCSFIPLTATAANPLTVSIGSAAATAGGTNAVVNVTLVNVSANLPRGINNSGFTIHYNNTVLDIVSVARGSLLTNAVDMAINPGSSAEISTNNGKIVLLHNDDSAGQRPITSDGIYAVLTFKAKSGAAPGNYPLTFQAGASSIGQMNTAGTFPEDFNMATVALNEGTITIPGVSSSDPLTVSTGTINTSTSTTISQPSLNPASASPATQTVSTVNAVAIANTRALNDIGQHWAKTYIEPLVASGIVNGYPDATFKPDNTITRAEFTNIITRALNLPSAESSVNFKDWNTTPEWARCGIAAAFNAGIINGDANGTFQPEQPISRSEMAVIIVRAMKTEVSNGGQTIFNDHAHIPDWALPYVQEAVKLKIITGNPDNRFLPDNNATRAEAATIIVKMIESK